jgi:nitrite reductase (NO-forming)
MRAVRRPNLILVAVALLFATAVVAAGQSNGRPKLELQPKASLRTEPAAWSHAPLVPPPITRTDQRRLIVNWTITETKAEIAPGVIYDDYWAIEGKVPGPVLRVREGDLVEVHLTNHVASMRNHNIDFHFVMGPGGGASATNVTPGESAVFEARAMAPGFYMFHCASPDIPTHIANGMYGFVIVEPAVGLPPADREYYVVQSELYTKDGNKGHQQFSMERGERADAQYVVFNGAVGALMGNNAMKAGLGEKIRLWVGNAGPNLISSFHVIGQIFDNVYREGDLISPPAHGIQTTLIPAGGSAVVEFASQVPGTFLLVDHAIFRLHHGAAGSIKIDGADNKEVFDPITAGAKAMAMSDKDHVPGPPTADDSPAKVHDHSPMQLQSRTPAKPAPQQKSKKNTAQKNAQLIPVMLTGPVTGISAANFPKAPGQEESGAGEAIAAPGGPGEEFIIRMLPGAGNYNTDPNASFSKPFVTIKAGTKVTWINTDDMVHFNKDDQGKEFETPMLKAGMRYSHVFKTPGVYKYTCVPHPWMRGTISVR